MNDSIQQRYHFLAYLTNQLVNQVIHSHVSIGQRVSARHHPSPYDIPSYWDGTGPFQTMFDDGIIANHSVCHAMAMLLRVSQHDHCLCFYENPAPWIDYVYEWASDAPEETREWVNYINSEICFPSCGMMV